jgi:hypothetical protein
MVAMEACGSVHHWGRQLVALGHEVKLIPPAHVRPYVRRNKNDAVDAAAICEAAGRPGQRFVPVRSIENRAILGTMSYFNGLKKGAGFDLPTTARVFVAKVPSGPALFPKWQTPIAPGARLSRRRPI